MPKKLFLAVLFALVYSGLFAQQIRVRKLEKIIANIPAFEPAHVGVAVQRLEENKLRVNRGENQYMTPASNTKLMTFLASVATFDQIPMLLYQQDSTATTHFYTTAYPLLLHPFYGDSLLLSFLQKQKQLTYHPKPAAIPRLGPGWSWDDFSYYYSAPPSAFPIYGNVIEVLPDASKATPFRQSTLLTIEEDPAAPVVLQRKEWSNTFIYNPTKHQPTDSLYRPFLPSDSLFVELLGSALQKKIYIDSIEGPSTALDTLFSTDPKPLYQALLRDSDNLVAESLMLMVGQQKTDTLSVAKAIAVLQEEWASWLPDPIEWVDGSGVSRYNMVTPRTLVAVLQKIYTELGLEGIQEYFPEGGVNGTLKAYSFDPNLKVFAKTGTLRHNHNLSGFFQGKKGHWYAFSIMVNHYTSSTSAIRKGIAQLLDAFYQKL